MQKTRNLFNLSKRSIGLFQIIHLVWRFFLSNKYMTRLNIWTLKPDKFKMKINHALLKMGASNHWKIM